MFLRNDDLAGLAKYYEKWLAKNPADVDAIARLAKNLASQGRAPRRATGSRRGWSPPRRTAALRQALIDQYVFEQNFAAAAQQYEALDKADPNNPDTLREWGKLLMRDAAKPEAERRAAAAAVWQRLLEKKPNDPVVASQVADLMRTAERDRRGDRPLQEGDRPRPERAQYREYLGEYYHSLKRSDGSTGHLAADRRGAEPHVEEPRPAGRGLRRLRLPQGGHRRDGRRHQPGERRLHAADDLRRVAAPGRPATTRRCKQIAARRAS